VRLFAVGLASVKVAENFNMMATSLISSENSFIANALCSVAMLAILVVGHSLNLAMAGLSVLVHAVRLNTLEFSNHKGVSWSGRIYTPFKRKNLNKGE
jgi:V/A-type H+-transporting ATPase subunit I